MKPKITAAIAAALVAGSAAAADAVTIIVPKTVVEVMAQVTGICMNLNGTIESINGSDTIRARIV